LGTPSKRRYFDPIGSFSLKTVADKYTHAAYHNMQRCQVFFKKIINIDDLERP